jgi:thiamine biosynthesis lipoprotein
MSEIYIGKFVAMASPCEIVLAAADEAQAADAMRRAIAEVRRIEHKYSRYRDDGIVHAINTAAGRPTQVDEETAALIDFAARLHAQSDGLFDITSGVLRRVWDFKSGRIPSQQEIDAVLPLVGWDKVQWGGREIRLPVAGMELDFGGFGKEYAADRAGTLLHSIGYPYGFVNLGGDVRVLGPQPGGMPWRVGVQHPREPGRLLGSIPVASGALATSGDYERYLLHEGTRYCHILNPKSGWPVRHWQSVSALAPICTAAGALTTVAMLMEDRALPWLDAQRVAYLAIDAQGCVRHRQMEETSPEDLGGLPTVAAKPLRL